MYVALSLYNHHQLEFIQWNRPRIIQCLYYIHELSAQVQLYSTNIIVCICILYIYVSIYVYVKKNINL